MPIFVLLQVYRSLVFIFDSYFKNLRIFFTVVDLLLNVKDVIILVYVGFVLINTVLLIL